MEVVFEVADDNNPLSGKILLRTDVRNETVVINMYLRLFTDVIQSNTTIYDLNHFTLLHIMKYLTLKDVISFETLGYNVVEAAEDHYTKFKSVSINTKPQNSGNHLKCVDIAPEQTCWQKFLQFICLKNDRFAKHVRTLLKRIGPYIQRLSITYGEYRISEIVVICDLVREYCVSLKSLHYIGPLLHCSIFELSRIRAPDLRQLEELKFYNLKHLTDKTIATYLKKCRSTLTTLSLCEMQLTGSCLRYTGPMLHKLILRRNKRMKMKEVMRCLKTNPRLQEFSLEYSTKPRTTTLAELVNIIDISHLGNLVAIDLNVANVHQLNKMLTTLPYANNIERLSLTIRVALSDDAVAGFIKFKKLKILKLAYSVHCFELQDIFIQLSNCKFLTSLELINFHKGNMDMGLVCKYLQRLTWLKLMMYKKVKNLPEIAFLPDLKRLGISLSGRRLSSAEVNVMLQQLARKNDLEVLGMRLMRHIELTEETITALKLFTRLQYVKYNGFLEKSSCFYCLGNLPNLVDLTYVHVAITGCEDTCLDIDFDAMKRLISEARNIARFTIVCIRPNSIQREVRSLESIRSGLRVQALSKQPHYFPNMAPIRK